MSPKDLMRMAHPGLSDEQIQLLSFKISKSPVCHQRFNMGLAKMAQAHATQIEYREGSSLLILGPSGVGKSALVKAYASKFPKCSELGHTSIPVLNVTVPSAPTSKSIGEAILTALRHPKPGAGTSTEKTFLIIDLFRRASVQLLILDELHHLLYGPNGKSFEEATEWLKNLISLTDVAIVACGLAKAEAVVDSNEQLSRRFSLRSDLTPFVLEHQEDFAEFRSVLKTLQTRLPLPVAIPLHEANMARRMHVASYGLIDFVCKILEGAVVSAITAGRGEVELETLAAGFRACVWRKVPDRLNPFHLQSPLRPLDRPGEYFHRWELATRDAAVVTVGART